MDLNSIPKIYTLGTRFNASIFDGPVVIEEKIDGSQFSFGVNESGELKCRSKGTVLDLNNPGMFKEAVNIAKALASAGKLQAGYVYQCEYVAKPKHNVLAYGRVPAGYLVLFDVRTHAGEYHCASAVREYAALLGLEPVPVFYDGPVSVGPEQSSLLEKLLDITSVLGNVKVEGVVVKNYSQEHPERPGHPMTAKYVSPQFKERQQHANPRPDKTTDDVVTRLCNALRTEARWLKAVQHLRERGELTGDMKDVGLLVKEIQRDVFEEEVEWIKQQLFDEFGKDIGRGTVQGFAQYYQKMLREGPTVFQEEVTKPKA